MYNLSVLPNFEVKLKPREAFFRVDREELIIDIEATYAKVFVVLLLSITQVC